MDTGTVRQRAKLLAALHAGGTLVLPNAWDAASAAVLADAGAAAVATTSAGVAWSLGHPDGQRLPRAELVAAIGRMAGALDVPLTADLEAGYGGTAEEVAGTVTAVLGAGAAGVNIEDAPAGRPGLYAPAAAAARIRAARAAADAAGVPDFVINARTDVYARRIGDPATRLDEVLRRAADYAEAGGDCLFVPGLADLAVLESLVARSPLPVNASTGPGRPTVAQLRAVGVRRVSVGPGMAQAAYTLARQLAERLLGTGEPPGEPPAEPPALGYARLNALLATTEPIGGAP